MGPPRLERTGSGCVWVNRQEHVAVSTSNHSAQQNLPPAPLPRTHDLVGAAVRWEKTVPFCLSHNPACRAAKAGPSENWGGLGSA